MTLRPMMFAWLTLAGIACGDRTPPSTDDADTDTDADADSDTDTDTDADTDSDSDADADADTDSDDEDGLNVTGEAATLTEVRDAAFAEGTVVTLRDVVVTGVSNNGVAIQDPTEAKAAWVYLGGTQGYPRFAGSAWKDVIAVGDTVSVTGKYVIYKNNGDTTGGGITEIMCYDSGAQANVGDIVKTGTGTLPAPIELAASAYTTAEQLEPYEMVLVKITGVTATGDLQEDGTWAFSEFATGENTTLNVDGDQFFKMMDEFAVVPGSTFTSITGPLYYSHGHHKVAPRSAADIEGFDADGAGEVTDEETTDEATDEATDIPEVIVAN